MGKLRTSGMQYAVSIQECFTVYYIAYLGPFGFVSSLCHDGRLF